MQPFGLFGAHLARLAPRMPGVIAPPDAPGSPVMGAPTTWGNRLAMAGAALKDVSASVEGKQGSNVATTQQQILARNMMAAQQAARQKFAQAANPTDQRSALIALSNAGGDVSPYLSIMKSGRPVIKGLGHGQIAMLDPDTKAVLDTYSMGVNPPSGYRWTTDGMSYEPIPGGPADPSVIGNKAEAQRGGQ